MAKVKITGHASGTGIFTVTAPNSNTDRTITLPDGTGTLAFTTGDDDKLPLAGGTMTGALNITLADNTDQLTLTSTDADANAGPNLRLYRNSGSPADGDTLGKIEFEGRNDNSQDVVYAGMYVRARDVSDGAEDASLDFTIMSEGTERSYMKWYSNADSSSQEIAFNDDSQDVNFRVESDDNANMLFVDGGEDRVGIGTGSPAKLLHLSEAADGTKLRFTRGGISEWDFSIGNTSTLTSVAGGSLELIPLNANTDFAIGKAGTTTTLMHVKGAGTGTDIEGDVTLKTGDIVFSTAGKGICLGVTSNTDANTLDDYEEGIWTPQITSTSGGSSMTYDSNTGGFYRKIGDSVFIWGFLGLTAVGNLQNGQVQIKNLPFNINTSVASTASGCLVTQYNNTSQVMSGPWLQYNTTERFVMYYANSANTQTAVLGGAINNTFSIRFYGQYLAA